MKTGLCRTFLVAACCALFMPASYSVSASSYENAFDTASIDDSIDEISLENYIESLPAGDMPVVKEPQVDEIEISEEEFDELMNAGFELKPVYSGSSDNNSFYYKQLTEIDKIYYDGILELCRQNKSPITGEFSTDKAGDAVLFYSGIKSLERPDWSTIIHALWYDHPEELETILFSQKYSTVTAYSGGVSHYSFYMYNTPGSNYTGNQVAQMESDLKRACNSLYNSLSLSGEDASKELAIHDALIDAVEYNYDETNKYLKYTAYGALVEKLPVCQGYATAFKMLMDKAGIETHVVSGVTGSGEGHAWNVVKLGSDYYEVDTTWDDGNYNNSYPYNYLLTHQYFNCTTDTFAHYNYSIPGFNNALSKHLRNSKHMGYLNPPLANGTRYSYNNIKKAYRVDFDGVKKGAYYYLPYRYTYTYEGKIVEMPKNMSLSRCSFNNWYTEKDGGTVVTANTIINSDITVYAHWNGGDNVEDAVTDQSDLRTVTLHYNYDNKTEIKKIAKGSTIGELPTLYRYGYDLSGWTNSISGGSVVDKNTVVSANLDIYAQWKPVEVSAYFYKDDGSKTVRSTNFGKTYGDAMRLASDYTKAGHTLVGWYKSFDSDEAISPDTVIDSTKPLYFYAHWKKNTYTVTYDANGGAYKNGQTSDKQNSEYDTYITVGTHEKPSKSGYSFTGWNTSKDATSGLTSYKVTGDTTLYAIWKKTCVVTLRYNYDDKTENIAFGEGTYYTLPKPERYGYSFVGWRRDGDTGSSYTSGIRIYKDTDFYAVWSPKKVYLHFNSTIGTPSYQSISVNFGSTFGEAFDRVTKPSKAGYKFEGWTDTAINDNENVLSRNTVIDSIDSYNFYAKFTQSNCTITLHYDYDEKTEEIKVVEGTYYELPKPERYGFTFVGWREGESESYILGTTIRKDTDFYAKWSQKQVNLYFFSSTGTPSLQTLTVALGSTFGEAFDKVTEPALTGYKFEGWTASYNSDETFSRDSVFDKEERYYFYSKLTQTPKESEETEESKEIGESKETEGSKGTEESKEKEDKGHEGHEESRRTYTVSYDALGGHFSDGRETRYTQVEDGTIIDLASQEVPVRDGSEFIGWTRDLSTNGLSTHVYTNNYIHLYAVWKVIEEDPEQETGKSGGNGTGENPAAAEPDNLKYYDIVDDYSEADNLPEDGIVVQGGNEYELSESGTATITAATNKNSASVNTGEYVSYGNNSFRITRINKNAYKNNKKLKKATIGSNIESIGEKAFNGCKKLSNITVYGNNLKSIGKGSFKGIKNGAKITIVCKDKKAYNKLVRLFKKAGAKKAKFKFKKG
ncbi:InlB B-repeat-containing protein [Butyrivibrio sp. AE3006]|uniref:InlB B-repeat-containing protein n=1 Tax=Butyrivibrio sp. AE3006 TaxID=1280673 RepID=UPI00041A4B09|nr:InlB B-repeat-containing protein [Butyrivibrio sp. AE3006]